MYNQKIDNKKLRETPLFAALEDHQFSNMLEGMHILLLQPGEIVFKQGQHAQHFFLVYEGQVKLYRLSMEGHEKVIEIIQPKQTFAEAVMFMQWQSYPVNAEAVTESLVLRFNNESLLQLLRESTETCFRLIAQLSMRLHHWLNEIDNLTLQNATYRLIGFLQQQIPEPAPEAVEITLDIPKHVLASRLSIQPETLSRLLKNLSQEGILNVEGKVLTIKDIKRLKLK